MIRTFIIAWDFLTLVPIGRESLEDPKALGQSMAVFPLVGLALGAILMTAWWFLSWIFPGLIANMLVLLILIILTGGLHLDGLADTVDGLMASTREETLRIMRDGPIGAFGAIGIFFLLGFKVAGLYAIPIQNAGMALLLMPVIGRWVQVMLVVLFPYARTEGGLVTPFSHYAGKKEFLLATLFALVITVYLMRWNGLIMLAVVFVAAWAMGVYFKKRLGGITGDIIGASSEGAEALSLLVWAALAGLPHRMIV